MHAESNRLCFYRGTYREAKDGELVELGRQDSMTFIMSESAQNEPSLPSLAPATEGTGRRRVSKMLGLTAVALITVMHAALAVRRKASTPCLWPAVRGNPLAAAQRPLPSMIMAMWRSGDEGRLFGIRWLYQTCMISASLALVAVSISLIVSSVHF